MISLRPRIVMKDAEYAEWLKIVQDGQVCLLQQFHSASGMILDINKEYWRYQYLRVQRSKNGKLLAFDRYDQMPLRNDGVLCHWNSTDSWGKVFDDRIVPLHHEILPEISLKDFMDSRLTKYAYADRPLYEPEWYGDRVFLFSRRSHSPATKELLKRFKGYTKKVNEGTLITLFPGAEIYFEDWWQKEQGKYEGITFLYSEGL